MKKKHGKKLLLSAVFGLLFSLSGFSSNVVGNGDFESAGLMGTNYWVPVAIAAAQNIGIDTTGQISGKNSVKALVTTQGTYITHLGFYQFVNLPKASTYTVSFRAKASAACTIQSFFSQYFSTSLPSVMSPNITLGTTPLTYTYDITTSATPTGLCKLFFYYGAVPSGVTLYFDDITVVEKTQTTNRNLCNGDFETSMSNYLYASSIYTSNGLLTGTADATQNQLYYGWTLNKYTSHSADITAAIESSRPISGAQSIKLITTGTATASIYDRMFCWAFAGQKDQLYTLSFKAKASTACTLPVDVIALAYIDGTSILLSKSCDLTTAVQSFTFTSTQKFVQSSDGRALLRFQLGKIPSGDSIWLDDVVLVRTVPVTGVGLSPLAITLSVGSVYPLTATVSPYDANNQSLTWTSSDISKATVSASGVVTALGAGAVNITATSQDNNAVVGSSSFTISASAVPVATVTLSPATDSVYVGATQQLIATISPLGATNKTVNWASSNPSVATVDASGLVSGVAAGTATISASSQVGAVVGNASVVVAVPATGITLSMTGEKIAAHGTYQLSPTVMPATATRKSLIYTSNKTSVATVSATGLITGVAPGMAIITATTQPAIITASPQVANFSVTDTVIVYGSGLVLPSVISNNMVMQQNMQAALWGWGAPGESVTISASWGATASATADANGKWSTKIQTPKAIAGDVQTKHTLSFVGKSGSVNLTNILIGDVYLCSGQSNMQYAMQPIFTYTGGVVTLGVLNATAEIAAANYPNIRINRPGSNTQYVVLENNSSSWNECNPTNVANYPAVPYYFARELYNNMKINIPIGLVAPCVGGSSSQSWTRREALAADTLLKRVYLDPSDAAPSLNVATAASILYNGTLAPLIPYSLKGFLWYQGEANASAAGYSTYYQLNSTMIKDWRALWGQGNLPFLYVQLPAYGTFDYHFRDQQCKLLTLPNTGMAITSDLADADLTNIHPQNKKAVGIRLARIAEAKLYGQNITYTGPTFKSKTIEGSKIRISFHPETLGAGLASRNGLALDNFMVAGSDNVYVAATAVIDGNDVLVSATSVISPVNVSFAYTSAAIPNLINKDSIPACQFRTDTWDNTISFASTITDNAVLSFAPKTEMVSIYPVPATDVLHVEFQKPMGKLRIELIDVTGKLRYSFESESEIKEKKIDLSSCFKGFYIVRVISPDINFSKSFIIK